MIFLTSFFVASNFLNFLFRYVKIHMLLATRNWQGTFSGTVNLLDNIGWVGFAPGSVWGYKKGAYV